MASGPATDSILVIGDVNIDVVIVPHVQGGGVIGGSVISWNYQDQYRSFRRAGGTWLLEEIIKGAIALGDDAPKPDLLTYHKKFAEAFQAEFNPPCLKSITMLAKCPRTREHPDHLVYRLKDSGVLQELDEVEKLQAKSTIGVSLLLLALRGQKGLLNDNDDEHYIRENIERFKHLQIQRDKNSCSNLVTRVRKYLDGVLLKSEVKEKIKDDDLLYDTLRKFSEPMMESPRDRSLCEKYDPSIVVIHDYHGGFRDLHSKTISQFLEKNKNFEEGGKGIIVWKMSTPLAEGIEDGIWDFVWKNYKKRTIVVTNAESLRTAKFDLRDTDSFEQMLCKFVTILNTAEHPGPKTAGPIAHLAKLAACRHLIVGYGFGAFHYSNDGTKGKLEVHFCPKPINRFMAEPIADLGRMIGYASVLVGALVKGLVWSKQCGDDEKGIKHGIGLGVVLAEKLFQNGYAEVNFRDKPNPYESILKNYSNINNNEQTETPSLSRFEITANHASLGRWNRVDGYVAVSCAGQDSEDVTRQVARQIVVHGLDYVATGKGEVGGKSHQDVPDWAPWVTTPLPYREFGKIKTVDRWEIDSFSSIQALMASYRDYKEWKRPLSIAVFGPPGSGKSFTTQQILESVDKGAAKEQLEFNVAQFTSLKDLATAFHQARDYAVEKGIPLVIFDEFDTKFNDRPLGWLQYFLQPMQDGKFMDGDRTYKIGRAIFVFSGGTAHSFREFSVERKDAESFRAAKGPDFVSRLQGHLDIQRIDSDGPVTKLLMFRRAILLRSLLEKNLGIIIDDKEIDKVARIDEGVIDGFLQIPRYEHGLRSMEAIVQMATISLATRRFQVASLPPPDQLDKHVNAECFLRFVNVNFYIDSAKSYNNIIIHTGQSGFPD